MNPEEFRKQGHAVVDWIAEYLAHPERYPVAPKVAPGDLTDVLPASAPERGEPMEAILDDFRKLIVPGITHWNHPGFMGYFAVSAPGPGILAEALAAALDANGMVWQSSPAVTELEQVSLGWLRQWLGLPPEFFGVIFDTASLSTMQAIAAAREKADPDARTRGGSPGLVIYTSEQAHSSVEKGAIAIGVGQQNVRKIAVDDCYRMRTDLLQQAIERDLAAGLRPFCVSATVGTTSTTSVDPLPAIADIAERYNLWFHVDAAYGGGPGILPEFQHILDGAARADSLVTNPHKWLLTPSDCSAFYTRHPDIFRRAFSLIPAYLTTPGHPRAVNLMDYGVPLGRRFRALKLWFVLRFYGREGVEAALRKFVALGQEFAALVDSDARFERSAPAPFSVVNFRYKGTDEQNKEILRRINASGEFFLSHTELNGKFVLHAAIGNIGTTHDHIVRLWDLIRKEAAALGTA